MPRRSSIEQLEPRIREAVDQAVRGGATIDEIVARIGALGGDVSRSAAGRYVRRARLQLERYREAQEVARMWVGRLEEEPQGDVGRLLSEMLRTVAFRTLADMDDDGGDAADASQIMLLARAIKDLASADKTAADRELRIRKEIATKAAEAAVKTAADKGLGAETIAAIRAAVLGVQRAG
jgi:hypothetical protein